MIQKICNLALNAIRLQVLCALVVVFIACKSILICLDICSICQNMTRNNTEKIHPCKRSVHIRGTEGSNKSYWFQCFWFKTMCPSGNWPDLSWYNFLEVGDFCWCRVFNFALYDKSADILDWTFYTDLPPIYSNFEH